MKTPHTHHITLTALASAFVLTLGFSATPAFSQPQFEGRIGMKITQPSAKNAAGTNMLYCVKGSKVRLEMQPDARQGEELFSMAFLMDMEKQQLNMLLPEQKMYYSYSFKDQKVQKPKAGEADFKPTGRTDTILGYKVEEYANVASKGEYAEMWLTKGIGTFKMMAAGPGGKMADQKSWEKYIADNGLFPMRVLQYDKKGGKLVSQMDVTKVERATLPASLFELPSDYKKFSIGNLFKGIGENIKNNVQQ